MTEEHSFGDWIRPALPLLLLDMLSHAPSHGYGLIEQLRELGFDVRGTTVYPQLTKLQHANLVSSHWQTPETGPARKILTITSEGQRHRDTLQRQWLSLQQTLNTTLDSPPPPETTPTNHTVGAP
ncbi:hypothetical protein BJF89_04740 [Corynebacterium sp. CNJ-954]|uniref:PadR family transcriptional regulator n=1 Tax=Corynebacterium sp. CNJ-954 TaxID=1904962 RepID=UPI0009673C01|nr:PadR family transcriptional regulator [Corynebacterium sp. CNJ-954]OLT52772.1 hypothetical protein BJF89_04740 [Corynebacterium sp. CNJ-954]